MAAAGTSDHATGGRRRRLAVVSAYAMLAMGVAFVATALNVVGCGHSSGGTPTTTGTSNTSSSAANTSSSAANASSGPVSVSQYDAGFVYVNALDAAPPTMLPPLPPMSNVVAQLDDDSVTITFDPVAGAFDYRVYPLPSDSDIGAADGGIVINDGTYRCAGTRETPPPNYENEAGPSWVATQIEQNVGGYQRTMADATLGYVYTAPGPGLVPVYVLGESNPNADNSSCYYARWNASRVKKYTTSADERTQLLATFARDDGIVFYVPAAAATDGSTTQVYFDDQDPGTMYMSRFYFPDGAEAAAHPNKQPAFSIMTSQAPGTQPLMRVYYANNCGWSHDELVAGTEWFNRVYQQGDQLPWWSLLWTNLTGPTTLVVEALDARCPFQGHLSPQSLPSIVSYFGNEPIIHQPYVTIDDVRAASATGEVFINGQYGPAWMWSGEDDAGTVIQDAATSAQLAANTGAGLPLPQAIARSFVKVQPQPHASMDFLDTFSPGSTPETFTTVPCGVSDGNCYATWRQQSPTFDQMFIDAESDPVTGDPEIAYGQVMGEWWVTYGDVGADTNGKYRLTANQHANMDSSTFLHVTMEADAYSTARRYPQILISDQDAPVQYNLVQGHTLIIQPRGEVTDWYYWPIDLDLQICNLRTWDVNDQCPQYDLYHVMDGGAVDHLAPNDEVGEHASVDHRVLFDVYASTKRVYVILDGKPYGCADMPSVGVPSGQVTVTWGDALYHSAVDLTLAFHTEHMQIDQRRHYDNLGFSSGVPAPAWDESRLPCAAPISP